MAVRHGTVSLHSNGACSTHTFGFQQTYVTHKTSVCQDMMVWKSTISIWLGYFLDSERVTNLWLLKTFIIRIKLNIGCQTDPTATDTSITIIDPFPPPFTGNIYCNQVQSSIKPLPNHLERSIYPIYISCTRVINQSLIFQ